MIINFFHYPFRSGPWAQWCRPRCRRRIRILFQGRATSARSLTSWPCAARGRKGTRPRVETVALTISARAKSEIHDQKDHTNFNKDLLLTYWPHDNRWRFHLYAKLTYNQLTEEFYSVTYEQYIKGTSENRHIHLCFATTVTGPIENMQFLSDVN